MVVDHVKVVLKSGKKHSSQEKLRALNLLDKCVVGAASNPAFVSYVQKKIMDRLRIMSGYAPKDMPVYEADNLPRRGAHIFMADEADTKHACLFLV